MNDPARATALLQRIAGETLDQLGVGVGEVQLRFTRSTISLCSVIGTVTAGGAAVAPWTIDGLSLLVPMLGGRVIDVAVAPGGELSLCVGPDGIVCRSDLGYEAWAYIGPDNERVVSLPGGNLAIWDAAG